MDARVVCCVLASVPPLAVWGRASFLSDDFRITADAGAADGNEPLDASGGSNGDGARVEPVDGGGQDGSEATAVEAGADFGIEAADSAEASPSVDGRSDADDAQALPRSCTDLHNAGIQTDGTYTIDIDGPGSAPAFAVYCKDIRTVEPTEYLELPANPKAGVPNSNVSGFAGGSAACPYPIVTLAFLKVRLGVPALQIDPTDRTFAYFEEDAGSLATDPSFKYGAAGSCVAVGDMSGRGSVDLTGTPFRIAAGATFVPAGYGAAGTSIFSANRKRVDLTGGGYGGWNEIPADAGGIGIEFSP